MGARSDHTFDLLEVLFSQGVVADPPPADVQIPAPGLARIAFQVEEAVTAARTGDRRPAPRVAIVNRKAEERKNGKVA